MSPRPVRNMAASIKQRLLNLAKKRGENFNFLLARFAVERLLFRLAQSEHGKDFVLKGAMLFHLRLTQAPHRATRDLDLLGRGTRDTARIEAVFQSLCRVPVPDDGLTFLEGRVRAERIKQDDEYLGVRVRMDARMGSARIPLQIDVGFGDAVVPAPKEEQLATLLDLPAPSIKVYPWETVIAEKFNALVELGLDNSRMKDYLDLHYLASTQSFDGATVSRAIRTVFKRRHTPLPPEVPEGLRPSFGSDSTKQTQWRAFVRKLHAADEMPSLSKVVAELQAFLMPPADALLEKRPFDLTWRPPGPWRGK